MRVSILIVNWKSREFLRKCLLSIRETCSSVALQIIVVDGASYDGSAEMIARDFPEVEFVQSRENLGFGRCNNLGFQKVAGEALLLLNPDTELTPGAVEEMLAGLQTLPRAGILGPRILNTDQSLQTSCVQALPTPLNQALGSEFLHRLLPRSRLWARARAFDSREPIPVQAVSGACMMLRADTFRMLGGFTPDYFMYAEDMDLCLKAQRAGLLVYHIPSSQITHHGGGSSKTQFSKFSAVVMREALHTYMTINHGPFTAFAYRCSMAISAASRIVLLVVQWPLRRASQQSACRVSLLKWWAILRWAVGAEQWVRSYGTSGSLSQSQNRVESHAF